MHLTLFTLSIDPTLGRLSYELLSDQANIEIMLEQLTPEAKQMFQDGKGNYRDICSCSGVQCDADGAVTAIHWQKGYEQRLDYRGTISLAYAPVNLSEMVIMSWGLLGKLCTASLPVGLKHLNLLENRLSGNIALDTLPAQLKDLNLAGNEFSGSCDLTALPPSLEILDLGQNAFTGSVELTKLPEGIDTVTLSFNQLSGTLRLDGLPNSLTELHLNNNSFVGSFVLQNMSEKLEFINASGNMLSGTAIVPEPEYGTENYLDFSLENNMFEAAVLPDRTAHLDERFILASDVQTAEQTAYQKNIAEKREADAKLRAKGLLE